MKKYEYPTNTIFMKSIKYYLFCVLMLLASTKHHAQNVYNLEGAAIEGLSNENLGSSMSASSDGSILAMGAASANSLAGLVRVYQLSGGVWTQMGSDISGGAGDSFGSAISLSADGTILAVGARNSDDGFPEFSTAGYVKIYEWSGSAWIQKGVTLLASEALENFGYAVSLSPDGQVLAVGAPGHNGLGTSLGATRVYQWSDSVWTKTGSDVLGTRDFETSGTSVSVVITGTDSVLAVGSPAYESVEGNFDNAGRVRVYRFSEGSWGETWDSPEEIMGSPTDILGSSLSLSADGDKLAVGAPKDFLALDRYGFVKVYDYDGSSWQLMGDAIFSKTEGGSDINFDDFGKALALSGDGTHLIIGAPTNVAVDNPNGRAELYSWSGSAWEKAADAIPGTTEGEGAGESVAISFDGSALAVGSPSFGAQSNGKVRAFKLALPDTEGPTVAIESEKSVVNNSPFTVYFSFSEAVSGLTADDVQVVNGSSGNLQNYPEAVIPNSYSVDVTPDGNGNISIQIPAAVVQDGSGNDNVASETIVVDLDLVQPTAIIQGIPSGPATFNVSIIFSEPVIDFVEADISVANASLSNFQGSDSSYTVDVTPAGTGDIVISLAANVLTDEVGNGNVLAERSFDQTAPMASIGTTESDTTSTNPFPITITFNEEVSGFVPENISVMNGEASNLQTEDNITFTADVLASADGLVSVFVEEAKLVDISGNANAASDTLSVFMDTTGPTVLIFNDTVSTTNGTTFPAFIVASEKVSGLILEEILVENGTASGLTGPFAWVGKSYVYVANITANGEGTVQVSIAEGAMEDPLGNSNVASNIMIASYDAEVPTAQIIGTPDGQEPFSISIVFNEPVVGFVAGDVSVTGATLGNFQGQDSLYTATITPSGGVDITVSIAANVARDAADNLSLEVERLFDITIPTVVLSTTVNDSTNVQPIPLTITFSEAVSGFEAAHLSILNGNISNVATADSIIFTADISAQADGMVSLSIAGGLVVDARGNANTASDTLSIYVDRVAPTVLIETDNRTLTNGEPFQIAIGFSENVIGLEMSDVSITNASISAFSDPVDFFGSQVYLTTVTPNMEGNVIIAFSEGGVTDKSGNSNTVAVPDTVRLDLDAPTATLSYTGSNPTNITPFEISISFNEPVKEFEDTDLLTTNGMVTSLIMLDNMNYRAEISPINQGQVFIELPADAFKDEAGNLNNEAANTVSIRYDTNLPVVSLSTTVGDTTNAATFSLTMEFSEPVKGFAAEDLLIGNATASEFNTSDSTVFTASIQPIQDGKIDLSIAQNMVQDAAGNYNGASNLLTIVSDRTSPTFVIPNLPKVNNGTAFAAQLFVTEKVTGSFGPANIQVSNATISDFVGLTPFFSGMGANFTVTPNGSGDISFQIAAGAVSDAAGNGNTAMAPIAVLYDATAPTVSITAPNNVLGGTAFEISFQFSEKTLGLLASEVTLTGGNLGELSTTDSLLYKGMLTPLAGATSISVTVPVSVAQDLAGNANTASATKVIEVDVVPTVAILNAPAFVNNTVFAITVKFSEAVTGFVVGDITLSNATASNFQGTGDTYTATITPNGPGNISLSIAAAVAKDAGNNDNTASAAVTVTYDGTAPTLSISGAPTSVNKQNPIILTFTFSEAVTGFTIDDVMVNNASKANFTSTSTSVYTLAITPLEEGNFGASVAANAAHDAAGNGNVASNVLSIVYDKIYSGGTGTEADPYLIANEADLRALSESIDDFGAHFKQTADIKMSTDEFMAIGINDFPFTGTYDGFGFIIDGLSNIKSTVTFFEVEVIALFGYVRNGTVKNLGVTSINLKGEAAYSGLIGFCHNCTILNCYTTGEIESTLQVSGGLVSVSSGNVTIRNSFSDMNLKGDDASSGLVVLSNSTLQISNSYSLSNLVCTRTNAQGYPSGALVHEENLNARIENSYFSGTTTRVSGTYYGIIFSKEIGGSVINSFWDKELSGIERTEGGGTPLTTTQMKTQKTFTDAGWDFTNTWYFPFNYPVLKWQVDRMKEFTISGKVVDENGNAFTAGSIITVGPGGIFNSAPLDAQGKYKLDLPKGFHSLYVSPNNADAYLPTCYGNTDNLFKSKLIFYNHSAVDIKMIAKSQQNLLNGQGRVSGKVVSTANGGGRIVQGRVMDGDPLAGVSVMLIRVSDEQVMTTVVTDENGDFEIEGIPAGEYRLVVYIAGIATDLGDNTLNFDEEATTVEVTALVSEEGVTVTIDRILGLEDGIEVNFYPNPAYDHVNIQSSGKVTVKVINLAGVTLIERSFVDNMVLDVSSLKAGVHLIEISNAKGTTVRKLVKGN